MAQYMLLIYTPGDGRASPEEVEAELPRWNEYTEALRNAGALVAANALQPPDAATTVRVRDGESVIADGPPAETKETLGGYYVIDVPDREAAQKWASGIPSAPFGSVEVRPIAVFASEEEAAEQAAA